MTHHVGKAFTRGGQLYEKYEIHNTGCYNNPDIYLLRYLAVSEEGHSHAPHQSQQYAEEGEIIYKRHLMHNQIPPSYG